MASFAQALSEHPLASHATGEVVGQVLERLGQGPDLAVLFVTEPHTSELDDIVFTVRELLRPGTLIGTTAASVLGGQREVEKQPAISLWAASGIPATPVRLRAARTDERVAIVGWPGPDVDASGLLLIADPFSFPIDPFLAYLSDHHPGLPVVGGLASVGQAPGGNRLVIDNAVVDDGAIGVLLGPGTRIGTVVSQGCRPIGDAYVVTRSNQNVIQEIAGEAPVERLQRMAAELSPEDQHLLTQGIHLGLVIDEHQATFSQGDFLIRNLVGADRDTGAIATEAPVEVGSTVQFQVRDARSAHDDLRVLMAGQQADAALVFTCNGRGIHLFGQPDHDATVVSDQLDGAPVAGMFCTGELGPVGGRNYLHGFTASVLLFDGEPPAAEAGPPIGLR